MEAYTPPDDVIEDVERIMRASRIEIGGVEYITDDRDGQRYYYDTNALSNFVADGKNVIGFDPFVRSWWIGWRRSRRRRWRRRRKWLRAWGTDAVWILVAGVWGMASES